MDRYRDDWTQCGAETLQYEFGQIEGSYAELLDRHVRIHEPIFNRIEFSVGASETDLKQSTESMLKQEVSDATGIHRALLKNQE